MQYNTLEVLQAIWARSTGDYIFTPRMLGGMWLEGVGRKPDDVLVMLPDVNTPGDHYFSPLRYDGTRNKAFVGQPGVIYADLDNGLDDTSKPPSVLIVTSNGHGHGYWFLDRPHDPVIWEPYAKGWTQEIGADPGGWDITQVFRIPGTLNHKYPDEPLVYVQQFKPERVYKLEDFPAVYPGPFLGESLHKPVPSRVNRNEILATDPRVGLTARYWLTVQEKDLEALGKIDRSAIMWGVEVSLLEGGFTPEEVFDLMHFSGVNKWKTRPDKLWFEIQKAAHSLKPPT